MEINKTNTIAALVIFTAQTILLALKILNIVKFSWLWVFAPLWIPYATILVIGIIVILYLIFERIFNKHD